ncbi:hypothetical protein OAV33_01035 [bacterium]|nr:hypothetical protein [bacterium]
MNKYNITIEYSHSGFYKVSLSDHHGSRNVVYEQSVNSAFDYAINWCRDADERNHEKEVMNKAIAECIKLDKQAGITTNNRDGLD